LQLHIRRPEAEDALPALARELVPGADGLTPWTDFPADRPLVFDIFVDALSDRARNGFITAREAANVVRSSPTPDLVALLRRCHAALHGTRGAAISLAVVSPARGDVTWLGVGSVEGRVLSGDRWARRPKGSLALANGVPGHELPRVTTATLAVRPGDVLVLATDGIEAAFADSLDISGSTQAISERILADHWRPTDDALVVAVRYLGVRP
jgi:hypothetical protein